MWGRATKHHIVHTNTVRAQSSLPPVRPAQLTAIEETHTHTHTHETVNQSSPPPPQNHPLERGSASSESCVFYRCRLVLRTDEQACVKGGGRVGERQSMGALCYLLHAIGVYVYTLRVYVGFYIVDAEGWCICPDDGRECIYTVISADVVPNPSHTHAHRGSGCCRHTRRRKGC